MLDLLTATEKRNAMTPQPPAPSLHPATSPVRVVVFVVVVAVVVVVVFVVDDVEITGFFNEFRQKKNDLHWFNPTLGEDFDVICSFVCPSQSALQWCRRTISWRPA